MALKMNIVVDSVENRLKTVGHDLNSRQSFEENNNNNLPNITKSIISSDFDTYPTQENQTILSGKVPSEKKLTNRI